MKRLLLTSACAALFLAGCIHNPAKSEVRMWLKNSPKGIGFTDIALSYDGSKLAFEYDDNFEGKGPRGIGMFDMQTQTLSRISNPIGKELRAPSFSPDGRKLVVAIGTLNQTSRQIAEIDLASLRLTPVSGDSVEDGFRLNPIYQPGTGNILYSYGISSFGLKLLNPSTGQEQVVLEEKQEGFGFIRRPSFVGQKEVIFQGSGPNNFARQEYMVGTPLRGGLTLAYRLRFGGTPTFLSEPEELEATKIYINEGAFGDASVSHDGRIMLFNRIVEGYMTNGTGKVLKALFTWENGTITQRIGPNQAILYSCLSGDGRVGLMVADFDASRVFDLYRYDLQSGAVTNLNILERIRSNPEFALQ